MPDYFVRITPVINLDLSTIECVVKLYTDKYVISREGSLEGPGEVRLHYHLALFNILSTTETLRARLKKHFDAQIYISGKEIQDKIKAIAYTIKDGNYKCHGINVNDFLMAVKVSKPKVKYDQLVSCIEEKYKNKIIDYKQLVKELLLATVQCNRKVYIQHIKAQALLIKLKYDTEKKYIDLILEKIIDEY